MLTLLISEKHAQVWWFQRLTVRGVVGLPNLIAFAAASTAYRVLTDTFVAAPVRPSLSTGVTVY